MAGSNKTMLVIWAVAIVAYVLWALLGLTLVEGGARRLVSGLVSSEVVQDRGFDRFFWTVRGGGGKGFVVGLLYLLFVAVVAFVPMIVYVQVVARTQLAGAEIGARLFFLGIPLYMAWVLFFCVGLDPIARKLVGAMLDVTITKQVWVSTFNWSVAGERSGGTRALVAVCDFLVTGVGYLLPIALGLLRLVRELAKKP